MFDADKIYCAIALGEQSANGVGLHPREIVSPRATNKRKADFVRGRAVAKSLLADVLDMHTGDLWIEPDSNGVPHAYHSRQGRLPVSVSISHTQGFAAAACCTDRWNVGVDVERRLSNVSAIMSDFFTDHERQICIHQPCEPSLCGAIVWALKEAGLKALGTGFRVCAKSVCVGSSVIDPARLRSTCSFFPVRLELSHEQQMMQPLNRLWGWVVSLTELKSDLAVALACNGSTDNALVKPQAPIVYYSTDNSGNMYHP